LLADAVRVLPFLPDKNDLISRYPR
jgi:hypothetical protein